MELGSFLEIQAPKAEIKIRETINLVDEASLSCMLFDRLIQFNLGPLRSD